MTEQKFEDNELTDEENSDDEANNDNFKIRRQMTTELQYKVEVMNFDTGRHLKDHSHPIILLLHLLLSLFKIERKFCGSVLEFTNLHENPQKFGNCCIFF